MNDGKKCRKFHDSEIGATRSIYTCGINMKLVFRNKYGITFVFDFLAKEVFFVHQDSVLSPCNCKYAMKVYIIQHSKRTLHNQCSKSNS